MRDSDRIFSNSSVTSPAALKQSGGGGGGGGGCGIVAIKEEDVDLDVSWMWMLVVVNLFCSTHPFVSLGSDVFSFRLFHGLLPQEASTVKRRREKTNQYICGWQSIGTWKHLTISTPFSRLFISLADKTLHCNACIVMFMHWLPTIVFWEFLAVSSWPDQHLIREELSSVKLALFYARSITISLCGAMHDYYFFFQTSVTSGSSWDADVRTNVYYGFFQLRVQFWFARVCSNQGTFRHSFADNYLQSLKVNVLTVRYRLLKICDLEGQFRDLRDPSRKLGELMVSASVRTPLPSIYISFLKSLLVGWRVARFWLLFFCFCRFTMMECWLDIQFPLPIKHHRIWTRIPICPFTLGING